MLVTFRAATAALALSLAHQCAAEQVRGAVPASNSVPMLVFKIEFVELNHTKMRQMGFDLATLDGSKDQHVSAATAPNEQTPATYPDAAAALIETLKKSNLARVVCSPALATIPGQRVKLQVGGKSSAGASARNNGEEHGEVGTKLELVAGSLTDGRVKVNLRSTIIRDSDATSANAVDGQKKPLDVHTCAIETELTVGKPKLIPTARQNRIMAVKDEHGVREVTEEVGLAVLITAEAPEANDIPVRADAKEAPVAAIPSTTLK